MNVPNKRPAANRRRKDYESPRSAKAKAPKEEWKLADDQLDEALRQTFPASDALSMVQIARCT
jgi:hypothetical protein